MSKNMSKSKLKLELEVIFDYEGFPDYYSGHDHVFEDKLVACVPFGFPINYLETVQEIIDSIIDEIKNRADPEFLNEAEDDEELQEEIREILTEENIKNAVMETLPEGTKLHDRFFDVTPEEEEEIKKELEESFYDGPMLIGYIHVWKVDEDTNQ
jgi:signal recognition particle GTPase